MKKYIILLITMLSLGNAYAQVQTRAIENQDKSEPEYKFSLGNGLNISFYDKSYDGKLYKHHFSLGGNIATALDINHNPEINQTNQALYLQRTRMNLSGDMYNGKFGFFMQMDFVDAWALLDAYVSYIPYNFISISVGQALVNTNNSDANSEDIYRSFVVPSLLSRELSGDSRREFGLFINMNFNLGNVVVKPSLSVTSGDGRNSFGSAGTYFDEGGLKYGGRLDILPLGDFTQGNLFVGADLAREKTPKLAIGIAGSINQGANHPIGDGHMYWDTEHPLYNSNGDVAYADYVKSFADILFKFRGFTFTGEFGQAIAYSYKYLYTDPQASIAIAPGRISAYYYLANGINIQSGYLFKNNFAVDIRYSHIFPEFDVNSLAIEKNRSSIAFSKYMKGNKLKLQTELSYATEMPENEETIESFEGAIVFQVIF